jgi:SAM-dependent methyltransferase
VTLPSSYFDAMYAASADPWGFAERWYEQRKYALTMACLPHRRYASGYEPGCSVGVLSEALAGRCDQLLCSDGSAAAVASARARLAASPHVTVEQRRLPERWPLGSYDLVVLSELLYYFDPADLDVLLASALPSVRESGVLVAVHWRHPVADYPQDGDAVHAALGRHASSAGMALLANHREDDFVLDVYLRPGPDQPSRLSVAAQEGLV